MNVIGRRKIFLTVSGLLVAASVAVIVLYGFKPGIDFVGGTLWQVRFVKPEVDKAIFEETLRVKLGLPDAVVTAASGGGLIARFKEIAETDHVKYRGDLKTALGEFDELRFEAIGSSVGRELRRKSVTAFIMVLVVISIYIAFAFRKVSRPIASWKYGVITLVTLFHDAAIPAGLMALLGRLRGVEIDTNFIVAILVVIGFSVHDTIVVFDRIRENLRLGRTGADSFESLVNVSVNQTFARSVNTSLTLVLVLLALFVVGSNSLNYFILTILVGTIVGTYSSIFVASPLLTISRGKRA